MSYGSEVGKLKCYHCGCPVSEKAVFCPRCGTNLKNNRNNNIKSVSRRRKSRYKSFVVIIVILIILLLSLGLIALYFEYSSWGKFDSEKLKAICTDYSSEYKVINENDDGTYEISIDAPDFALLICYISEENTDRFSARKLRRAIKVFPDCKKDYTFIVDNLNSEEINEKFIDEIAYDLMKSAIQNSNYQEGGKLSE